jgi:hypothetical protein
VAKFIDEKMICDPEEDVSVFTFTDEYEEWCVRMGVSLFFPLCLPSTNLPMPLLYHRYEPDKFGELEWVEVHWTKNLPLMLCVLLNGFIAFCGGIVLTFLLFKKAKVMLGKFLKTEILLDNMVAFKEALKAGGDGQQASEAALKMAKQAEEMGYYEEVDEDPSLAKGKKRPKKKKAAGGDSDDEEGGPEADDEFDGAKTKKIDQRRCVPFTCDVDPYKQVSLLHTLLFSLFNTLLTASLFNTLLQLSLFNTHTHTHIAVGQRHDIPSGHPSHGHQHHREGADQQRGQVHRREDDLRP